MTLTPEHDDPLPVPSRAARPTRELVIRVSFFAFFTTLAVGASTVLAYFSPKLGGALAVGATILAAIYAVKTFNRRR